MCASDLKFVYFFESGFSEESIKSICHNVVDVVYSSHSQIIFYSREIYLTPAFLKISHICVFVQVRRDILRSQSHPHIFGAT